MPSVTTTECTTEALIEMNITNTANWYSSINKNSFRKQSLIDFSSIRQSTNVYEGTEVQSSSTDGSTFYPMCRFYPALIM